ncbi:uncharacterized protein B0P05DRAFT_540339 [Gilbertella persicaria]|uniref:uncharacterized protein n=1 Tax=Gilbertella persicaria TaxID=101096 RepID=UPI00221EF977|nr:uncharacterized protein B0P05DRAFT_540339 [Gilbertella persicaria]KAI8080185.1 hypothetical protein B0P05DRAFT_540339 [Gilbertella persicaria]
MFLKHLLPTLTALLSSSCCVIQLLLNAFSISCAGFSILTPYRSILTSLTVILLSYQFYTSPKKSQSYISLIVSILLILSPDIVKWLNHSLTTTITTTTSINYRIQLDGLGCEACANRIKNTLNSIEWIKSTRVFFDNQTAIVQTDKGKGAVGLILNTIKSIDKKYNAELIDTWT